MEDERVVLIVHRGTDVAPFVQGERNWLEGNRRTVMIELDQNMPEGEREDVRAILLQNYDVIIVDGEDAAFRPRKGVDWVSVSIKTFVAGHLLYYALSDQISEGYEKLKFCWGLASAYRAGVKAIGSNRVWTEKAVKQRFSEARGNFRRN